MLKQVKREHQDLQKAEKALWKALVKALPRGTVVTWFHGDHLQHGEVIELLSAYQHGSRTDVRIYNRGTMKAVILDWHRIEMIAGKITSGASE